MRDSASRHRNLDLPELTREFLAVDPFTAFDEWLDRVEHALGKSTALLEIDEFERLDQVVTDGRFDAEDVMGMLRHLIQHRPLFRVLLAGSHTLDELQHWASYLINVQVIKVSFLTDSEALQLIERPVKDFALRYEAEASRRLLDITRGHPALVQSLCITAIVGLKNEQPPSIRWMVRLADVESAVPKALEEGAPFIYLDIEKEVGHQGRAILRFMASQGEGASIREEMLTSRFPEDPDTVLVLLLKRDLIEYNDHHYRFQVEMIRRWFSRSDRSKDKDKDRHCG